MALFGPPNALIAELFWVYARHGPGIPDYGMSHRVKPKLQIIERQGPEEYSITLGVQTNLLEAKVGDHALSDYLILVEHEEVYTAGRGVPFQDTPASLVGRNGRPIPWVEIGRGGKATFHGPGQLVIYPIFDLEKHGKDVHIFLRRLERVVISALQSFGVELRAREGHTGIWSEMASGELKKVAAMGIGVRKWVTYHGIAINIDPDLKYFKAISPCGFDGASVTSLEEIFSAKDQMVPTMQAVKRAIIDEMASEFDFDVDEPQKPVANPARTPRPDWLKVKAPGSAHFLQTNDVVRKLRLVTVCEEAMCPNIGECWTHHTATFMIMGDLCTRRCSFCAVKDGTLESLQPLDPLEPYRVGRAVSELGLKHVVITSVNRDDLADMGAEHFDKTVRAIQKQNPDCKIELLIPDMRGRRELVKTILQSGLVSVLNHNIETVPRLYRTVRPGANLGRSLGVLGWAKELHPEVKTKSGVMVGLGESTEEVLQVMDALRVVGVEILTIGQYLQPTKSQLAVERFVTPDEFEFYKTEGVKRGFTYVESGPLVRSSYHAWQHSLPEGQVGAVPFERPVNIEGSSRSL